MTNKRLAIIITAILAVIALIGCVYIYTFDPSSTYSADCSMHPDRMDYSAGSGISVCYDVVLIDNGSMSPASEYYLYWDDSYKAPDLSYDMDYYTKQLKLCLENRGISVRTVDSDGLKDMLVKDISDTEHRNALIVCTGVLPDTVYSGDSADLVFQWMSSGGYLYWSGTPAGSYYSSQDSLFMVSDNQQLFFGCECLQGDVYGTVTDITDNCYKDSLSLGNGRTEYGVDVSLITGRDVLSVGVNDSTGHSSVSFVQFGEGMICVNAGRINDFQRTDIAQIVASHLTCSSEDIGYADGSVTRETKNGSITVTADDTHYYSVYICFGGYYLVYAKCFDFKGIEIIHRT